MSNHFQWLKSWLAAGILLALVASPLAAQSGGGPAAVDAAATAFTAEDWPKAEAAYLALTVAEPGNGLAWFRLGFSRYRLGKYREALAAYEKAEAAGVRNMRLLSSTAGCWAQLGDTERAFAKLSEAVDGGLSPTTIEANRTLDPLRGDARFAALLAKADLANHPCKAEPQAKQFDFWLGEWEVYDNAHGTLSGSSRIEPLPGGCLIVENYVNLAGYAGRSMNFWDPQLGKWRQIWVDNSGTIMWFEGGLEGSDMVFEGDQFARNGDKQRTRMRFTPQPDGSVRQFIEGSTDGGKTWKVDFDGRYVRKP
ncbi:MAG TPA: tetratricopeptide repeat protein [Thermoanaerobaculia bacterium]|nr:tetratricopeptide repeat protein [Thermoanaerobaculia bacterium]